MAISANAAKLAYGAGTAGRIALATRAASWARIGVDAAEVSGELTLGVFIFGEVCALRAQGAAIRQGTCQP